MVFLLFISNGFFFQKERVGVNQLDYLIELNKERVGVAIPSYVNKA